MPTSDQVQAVAAKIPVAVSSLASIAFSGAVIWLIHLGQCPVDLGLTFICVALGLPPIHAASNANVQAKAGKAALEQHKSDVLDTNMVVKAGLEEHIDKQVAVAKNDVRI